MRVLHLYVLQEWAKTFGLALASFTFLLFLGNASRLLQKGLDTAQLASLFPYLLPYVLSYTLPVAVLAASIITYGRLAADNEITALRATGIHLQVVIVPIVAVAILLSLLTLYASEILAPLSHRRIRETAIRAAIQNPLLPMRLGLTDTIEIGQFQIYARKTRGDEMEDVTILFRSGRDASPQLLRAKRVRIVVSSGGQEVRFQLFEGTLTNLRDDPTTSDELSFKNMETTRYRPTDYKSGLRYKCADQTTAELKDTLAVLEGELAELAASPVTDANRREVKKRTKRRQEKRWEVQTEIQKRRALAASGLVLVLIGAPLGILTRRGKNLVGIGLGAVIFLAVYYPLFIAGQRLAEEGALPAWLGLWWANGLTLILGAILTIRVFRV